MCLSQSAIVQQPDYDAYAENLLQRYYDKLEAEENEEEEEDEE